MMIRFERVWANGAALWRAALVALCAGLLVFLPLTSAVAVIGGTLALLALLRWPELALYLVLFAIPYGSWFPLSVGVGNVTAVDLGVVLLLGLWMARMIARERRIVIRWPPLTLPFVLFLGAALLSTTVALSLQYAVKEMAKWVEMFVIYVYVANELEPAKASRTLVVLFLAGASEAAIGIYQFLFRVGPEGFMLFGRFIRAYGTFEQPNPYAGYLALVIPIAFGVILGVMHRPLVLRSWGLGLLAAASLGALGAALLMSWSRGAWLGTAAALVVVVIVQSRRALILAMAVTAVVAVTLLLSSFNIIPSAIAARFSGLEDYVSIFDVRGVKVDDSNYAVVERMAHWQAALEMFSDHPLLGVGFGNYAVVYPAYALPHWDDPLGHAHNYYLNVAAEAGGVGVVTFGLLWLAAFWQGWRAVRVSQASRGLAAGCLGVLVALSIHNGFDNLFVHGMHVQVGVVLGITAWLNHQHEWSPAKPGS